MCSTKGLDDMITSDYELQSTMLGIVCVLGDTNPTDRTSNGWCTMMHIDSFSPRMLWMTNSPRQRQHDNTSGTTKQQSTHPMTTGLRTRYEIANRPYCCATKRCVAYSPPLMRLHTWCDTPFETIANDGSPMQNARTGCRQMSECGYSRQPPGDVPRGNARGRGKCTFKLRAGWYNENGSASVVFSV